MKQIKQIESALLPEEIAAAYVFPDQSSKKEKDKGRALFWECRKKKLAMQTDEDKCMVQIMQLKFLMQDYISSNEYNEKMSFGFFLKEYIASLAMKNKDFAADICVRPTELSHYLSNRRRPNEELMIRLEIHSNKNIPAVYWYRILEKEQEHEIVTNLQIRKAEQKKVKNKLSFTL